MLKYGFGLSLLGTIPLTLYPLHDTFAPWLALCSPQYSAAAKAAEEQGLGPASVQLSQVQDSLLTSAIMVASYALAVLLPNVEFVFGLAGSTASTLMVRRAGWAWACGWHGMAWHGMWMAMACGWPWEMGMA